MYKIKFGEHSLHILSDVCSFSFERIGKNKALIYNYTKAKKLDEILKDISNSPVKNHIIFHLDTETVFAELSKKFTFIKAAGGVVINEKKQMLFILRNGKWDLPKGKVESNETIELGAIREVEEECGIKVSRLEKLLDITYHTYTLDNKYILKANHWYIMYADSAQNLIPQTEENIERVEWVDVDKMEPILKGSYESINDLILKFRTLNLCH